ncbi:hypothetical protein O6H91_05G054800 [Diphasiastrum complanatum]|uniref:Uncharacterized protein n=8 Tax=Diphasiastrum complanatum TaxID=34168 RepID=A0ACC2DNA7_DIPCM|nr:hypothetical protein O6H91_05G054800 [Diphasiastrum complanatum]KAJ7555779.1 hypothetical protein O6H91_05G054800 [Diphasiastrum complanatum]KAJ7555780.1 hypothetical protein O6H91_05G054800 [Diphasiastrum complanatum]KAJ7555781.1 hypothetical protein O6H91_05G054800 [Diphasiastrum complanatum]KAJ7555782.1 hypothetical protein O6H91_05G054800 [Diphasiastrum complanatum]
MAGRGRMPPAHMLHPGAAGLLTDPIIPRAGTGSIGQPGQPPLGSQQQLPPSMVLIEHKMATQHAEIQKLLTENQRLAAAHLALRQELASARQEVQHLQQQMSRMQMEEESRMMSLIEKAAKLEEDLRAAEPLKAELQRVHNDAQQLNGQRQELMGHIQQITQELQKSHADSQQSIAIQSENEKLRQELERSRVSCELEKKANTEQEERRQAMEKTLILLAKEVEKLHTDLSNEKKAYSNSSRGELYSTDYGMETAYSQSRNSYRDSYDLHQEGASTLAEHRRTGEETTGLSNVKSQVIQEASYASPHAVQSNVSLLATENSSEIWNAHIAPNGRTFYHNVVTGETQWEIPAKLSAASDAQRTIQSQAPQIHQEQIHASRPMHAWHSAPQGEIVQRESTELRQAQVQQPVEHSYLSNHLRHQLSQTQGQHLAHLQPQQNNPPPSLQPAQAQVLAQPAGQGHMHQLAAQMTQLIQGQFPYSSQISQYQMASQLPDVQAQSDYRFQSMTKSHPLQNGPEGKSQQAHSVSPLAGVGQYNLGTP